MKSDKDSSVGNSIDNAALLSSLGMVVIQFVSLEYSIIDTFNQLMPSVDRNFTFRLLAEDKFHSLLLKLKRIFLYQIKNKDLKKEFDIICKELNQINLQRNDFIHALFLIVEERGIVRFKLKPDIHIAPEFFEETEINQEDIDNFIKRIEKARESLSDLRKKIINLLSNEKEENGNQKENKEET